jgi:hypothetical protein
MVNEAAEALQEGVSEIEVRMQRARWLPSKSHLLVMVSTGAGTGAAATSGETLPALAAGASFAGAVLTAILDVMGSREPPSDPLLYGALARQAFG